MYQLRNEIENLTRKVRRENAGAIQLHKQVDDNFNPGLP